MIHEQLEQAYQQQALKSIDKEEDLGFIVYSGIENTEDKIKFAITKILEKHEKEDIFTPVFSCLKELMANATKAIAKKILIDDGIINNPDNSLEVVEKIRSILNEEALLEYGIKAKERRLSTRIYIKQKKGNLVLEVINNIPLTEKEQQKISHKIDQAKKYDNIAEFYMENPDPEAEGMGLGISMIVVLLKNIDISYRNFILTSDKINKTYAKIIIPLH